MTVKSITRAGVLGLCLLALVGCPKSEESSVTNPGDPIPDIRGTYASNTFWFGRATRASDGTFVTVECTGNIVIDQQSGGTFGGTFNLGEPCVDDINGTLVSGQVGGGGSISFWLAVPGQDLDDLVSDLTGCTIASGAEAFTGSVSGDRLHATEEAALDCPDEGRINLDLEADGTR